MPRKKTNIRYLEEVKSIIRHAVAIVFLTIGITVFVNFIMRMWIFQIAFPEQTALRDFEFEDFAFSTRETEERRDTNIVLINIGQLGRDGIAEQINIISKFNPKVIGVNVIFASPCPDSTQCPHAWDTLSNTQLHEAIKNAGNVVLPAVIKNKSLEFSDSIFSFYTGNGAANLIPDQDSRWAFKDCRSFTPRWDINGQMLNSFSVEIANLFDSSKASNFISRDNDTETINYKGNISVAGSDFKVGYEYYFVLDFHQVLLTQFDPNMICDKIILLGYYGDYLLDNRVDEMFFSPLNRVVLGKSLPDMYGTVVHANIISMILAEDYINRISYWNALLVSMLIVFLNAILFSWLYPRNSLWYDPLTILIPASQIILIAYLRYWLFTHLNYVLDLSMATVLLVSVSLSAGLYFGPLHNLGNKVTSLKNKK